MDRISSASNYQSVLLNIMSAQSAQNTAQQQVTTGKIADDLSGYASQADALTASRSLQARLTTYVANGAELTDKLTAQDQALSTVATATQSARDDVSEALANGDATALMTSLQSQFSQATSALNTQYNGQYLFSGTATNTAPVAASALSDLTGSGGVAGVFKNDQTKTVSRLDDNTTTTTGVLASDVATPLFTALQSIQAYSAGPNGPLTGTLTSAQTTFLQGVLTQFDSAYTTVNNAVAANGIVQDQVAASQTSLKDQQTALTNTLGDLTDADSATAASNLALAQTALQASAQVFATLNNASLLSVLGVTTA
jgi:flagellar hook-associated protein 3 FlgL